MTSFPDEWRTQLRQQYLDMGSTADMADQVVDLAIHAVDRAFESMILVADGAGPRVGINVLPLATQLLSFRAELAYADMVERLTANGATTKDMVLSTSSLES